MDEASNRAKRPRRSFTPEFKAEAVRLCQIRDRIAQRAPRTLDRRQGTRVADGRLRPRRERGARLPNLPH